MMPFFQKQGGRQKKQWMVGYIFFIFSVRLCGNQLPAEPIISTGSRMLLTYKTSEHSPLHTGFLAAYEGITQALFYIV